MLCLMYNFRFQLHYLGLGGSNTPAYKVEYCLITPEDMESASLCYVLSFDSFICDMQAP